MSTLQIPVCPGITPELVKKQAPVPQGRVGPENLPLQRAPRCCVHPCAARCAQMCSTWCVAVTRPTATSAIKGIPHTIPRALL